MSNTLNPQTRKPKKSLSQRLPDHVKIYQVGGSVRDLMMGMTPKDRDFAVTGATPDMMINAGFKAVGADFPVFLHPETGEEYALARTERKTGSGYHGFATSTENVTIEDDLARRDLTINAMAIDSDGRIIDPYHGQDDIRAKVLRHTSSAFAEDPCRVLRTARFSAELDFKIALETIILCQKIVESGELETLSPNRTGKEFCKAILAKKPSRFFEALDAFGGLKQLFPEVKRLQGQRQAAKHHGEGDAYIHTMMVLDYAAQHDIEICQAELSNESSQPVAPSSQKTWQTKSLELRFGALCHDIGKGLTRKECLPNHHGHEEAGVLPALELASRLMLPNALSHAGQIAARYHTYVHLAQELTARKYVEIFDSFPHQGVITDTALISHAATADHYGRISEDAKRPYHEASFFRFIIAAIAAVKLRNLVQAENIAGLSVEQRKEILHRARICAAKAAIQNQRELATRDCKENSTQVC